MTHKTKDKIILFSWIAGVVILIAVACINEIKSFIPEAELLIGITLFWSFGGIFFVMRPLGRLTSGGGYVPPPKTQEEWLFYYKKKGFILNAMQITPDGFCSLLEGEDISISCNNIEYDFVLSLKKRETEKKD